MNVTLYGIPGSHPVRAVRLMLEYKGIAYKNIDIFPVVTRFVVPHVLRFPKNRVPAMKIDGRKIQGTQAIARELDRVQPEHPLFPSDPAERSKVEDARAVGRRLPADTTHDHLVGVQARSRERHGHFPRRSETGPTGRGARAQGCSRAGVHRSYTGDASSTTHTTPRSSASLPSCRLHSTGSMC